MPSFMLAYQNTRFFSQASQLIDKLKNEKEERKQLEKNIYIYSLHQPFKKSVSECNITGKSLWGRRKIL